MDELNSLEYWVVNEIIAKFEKIQGDDLTIYTGDITHALFSNEIAINSYTYSSYLATEWIKCFFKDIGEAMEDIEAEGLHLDNPFTSPESFQIDIIIYITDYLIWRSKSFRAIERVEDAESTPQVFTVSRIQAIIDDFTALLQA